MASTRFGDKGVAIERLDVSAYTVPTDFPESDGTISWDKTTMVLVKATAGDKRSVGYSLLVIPPRVFEVHLYCLVQLQLCQCRLQ